LKLSNDGEYLIGRGISVLADDMVAQAVMIHELVMVRDGLLFVCGLFCACRC